MAIRTSGFQIQAQPQYTPVDPALVAFNPARIGQGFAQGLDVAARRREIQEARKRQEEWEKLAPLREAQAKRAMVEAGLPIEQTIGQEVQTIPTMDPPDPETGIPQKVAGSDSVGIMRKIRSIDPVTNEVTERSVLDRIIASPVDEEFRREKLALERMRAETGAQNVESMTAKREADIARDLGRTKGGTWMVAHRGVDPQTKTVVTIFGNPATGETHRVEGGLEQFETRGNPMDQFMELATRLAAERAAGGGSGVATPPINPQGGGNDAVAQLSAQVQALQAQLAALQGGAPAPVEAAPPMVAYPGSGGVPAQAAPGVIPSPVAAAPAPVPATPTVDQLPRITTKAEFDALPAGSLYRNKDGAVSIKE